MLSSREWKLNISFFLPYNKYLVLDTLFNWQTSYKSFKHIYIFFFDKLYWRFMEFLSILITSPSVSNNYKMVESNTDILTDYIYEYSREMQAVKINW